MGKRSAVVELFLGVMGAIERETRASVQREEPWTMETKGEQRAGSAVKQLPKSVGAGNPHATFCGNRGRATASGDPVPRKSACSLWPIPRSCRAGSHP